jgi:hypothetical protein
MDDVAPALLNKPELDEESAFYLNCFNDLSAARQAGFNGPNRIAIAEMQAYCDMFEIDERERFFYNIRAADEVFMEWVAKANK